MALLWGAPVALSFGLIAAVGSSLTTIMLAAAAVWFGGWVDWFIRRINEVVMILPLLPILIMVGLFYSRSIWVILGVVIALGIFGSGILSYRSMFLQVKESGYIKLPGPMEQRGSSSATWSQDPAGSGSVLCDPGAFLRVYGSHTLGAGVG